jgi:hypothetical protein
VEFIFILNRVHIFIALFFLLSSLPISASTPTDDRRTSATRITGEVPRIDGFLDDEIWQNIPTTAAFLQLEPVEGAAPSEETSVQIAYDEEALYIAVRCYDKNPADIVSRLVRRDAESEADWVLISLDPHLDRQTGRFFGAYASGSVSDGIYANDRDDDDTWNGVWEVKTAIDATGWVAEFRIPYYVLRFSPREEYVWGLNIERYISRKREHLHWNLMYKGEPGLVSQFGYLEGIRSINPPLHLEYTPYAMGRTIVDGGSDYFGNAGSDIRYGISSSLSLTAAINPDFGQVEADPAQLNLTAFEDFFDEQRPFFVEGADLFTSGDYALFYSRRIGRRPGYFALPEDATEEDRPEATTIIGALKLTGKTEGKTSFGLLQAVTASERADIARVVDADTKRDKYRVEPLTNYLVGRVRQDVLEGTSNIGLFASSVNRRDGHSAYVGAADWDLKFRKDTYNITGILAASRAGINSDRKSGYIAHIELDKRGNGREAEIGFAALSPGIEINDLGFLRRGALIRNWAEAQYFRYTPIGPFRELEARVQGELEWNYDGTRLRNSVNVSHWFDLHNYWRLHLHYGRKFEAMDDDDVRRGGPIVKKLGESWIHGRVETDERKMVSAYIHPDFRRGDGGRSSVFGVRSGLEFRPLPSVEISMEPRYERRKTDAQWVGLFDGNWVYGELESRTLDLTTRAELSFSPELSVELFLQPFIAIGDFGAFKSLTRAESYDFVPYALDENRDFHQRSLKSNLVLRWEFSPGSTLFIVWAQSRSAELADPAREDLEFRPLNRLGSSFSDDGDHVFLTKISYWIGG